MVSPDFHVCGFDFSTVYGAKLGEGFIEAHHTIPLSAMTKGKRVSTDDLVAVCSNCHRMLDRTNPPIAVEELVKTVKQNYR
jgi:5-methylcytosine-specific restriction enzyme A